MATGSCGGARVNGGNEAVGSGDVVCPTASVGRLNVRDALGRRGITIAVVGVGGIVNVTETLLSLRVCDLVGPLLLQLEVIIGEAVRVSELVRVRNPDGLCVPPVIVRDEDG